jgi:hypothetical protein
MYRNVLRLTRFGPSSKSFEVDSSSRLGFRDESVSKQIHTSTFICLHRFLTSRPFRTTQKRNSLPEPADWYRKDAKRMRNGSAKVHFETILGPDCICSFPPVSIHHAYTSCSGMGNAPSGTAAFGRVTWRLDSYALAGGRVPPTRAGVAAYDHLRYPRTPRT